MILGITGTRTFENKIKIKNFIFKLKDQTTEPITIISLGDMDGADKHIKKYALELGYDYKEMNPPHTVRNLYSMMSESFYEKPYSHKNMFLRNRIFCQYINKCVIFDDTSKKDKKVISLVKELAKSKKTTIILTA